MNPASKIALFVVLLLGAGLGVSYLMTATTGSDRPALPGVLPDNGSGQDPEGKGEPASPLVGDGTQGQDNERTRIGEVSAGSQHPQGIQGRVVDPRNAPMVDTEVYLMPIPTRNLVGMLRKGRKIQPAARTKTDSKGQFALGVARASDDTRYEVRILSDTFVDATIPGLTIKANEWFDAGRIRLLYGCKVTGTVTVEGSAALPIGNAKVMLRPATLMPTSVPTPGREHGIVADTDEAGKFVFENAPAGLVDIAAVAPGFARMEMKAQPVAAQGKNVVNIELPTGVIMKGVVTDARGNPLSGVKVDATALSIKMPTSGSSRSDGQGQFQIAGLVKGPYTVSAEAQGYQRAEVRPVEPGKKRPVQIVLEKQGAGRLRVFDKSGRLLRRYQVRPKRVVPGKHVLADVPGAAMQFARTNEDGIATITGLDRGEYVFQIVAPDHARTTSEPFKVTSTRGTRDAPLVEVKLQEGGSIEGVLLDHRGKPLAGARLRTLPNEHHDHPLREIFGPVRSDVITIKRMTTGPQGRFLLEDLCAGTYQLKFTHPDHHDLFVRDIKVQLDKPTKMRRTQMMRGTVVSGVVVVNEKPAGQVLVTLSPDETGDAVSSFHARVITDREGRFSFKKHVPPGRYQVMAARQTLPNPIQALSDYTRSRRTITVGSGQANLDLKLSITAN